MSPFDLARWGRSGSRAATRRTSVVAQERTGAYERRAGRVTSALGDVRVPLGHRGRAGARPRAHQLPQQRRRRLLCSSGKLSLRRPPLHFPPMSDTCCQESARAVRQRGILWTVLAINLALFAAELTAGLGAGSNALLGDSLDMLG